MTEIIIHASGDKKPLAVAARTVNGGTWVGITFACGTELAVFVDKPAQAMILANAFREAFGI